MTDLRVERFSADQLLRGWPWIAALLRPSVEIAGRRTDDVKIALLRGEMGLASVHTPNGAGLLVVQPGVFGGVFACWIAYAAVRVKLGPKAWLQTVRGTVRYFEDQARDAGCTEMRIGGRDWSRILPGYEPFDLGWRKAL